MNRKQWVLIAALAAALSGACSDGDAGKTSAAAQDTAAQQPAVLKPEDKYDVVATPAGPANINYRIIGTPIVGQPVTIDLQVESNVGDEAITLSYQASDATAISFPESQLRSIALAFVDEERVSAQQVTVIPNREGRLFLNVTAAVQTENGSFATVTAIPIQVGSAPRDLQENGVVTTDDAGDLIREMPASEN